MNIIKSSTPMKSDLIRDSHLETECLFGETVEIIDENSNWVYCKLMTDNYRGWIKKSTLGQLKKTTHRVFNKRTFIFKNKSEKSDILLYLPMGSRLAIEEIKSGWAEIFFNLKDKIHVGYVPSKHIVNCNHKVEDWVAIAQQLEGTPYRWGGRDTIGIDCSALLQMFFMYNNSFYPRDTKDQISYSKKSFKEKKFQKGDIIFWKGHVAMCLNSKKLIHAYGPERKVLIMPIIQTINRIEKTAKLHVKKIIKIKY